MPSPEWSHRFQPAVLFPFSGYDRHGQATVGTPVEIRVRWNDKASEAMDPQGNSISLDATAVVYQDIAVGSRMWQGSLEDWSGTGSALTFDTADDLMEVKSFDSTPDLRNRYQQRTVGLMRYKDQNV